LSAHDFAALAKESALIDSWNHAVHKWSFAYKSGVRSRFLQVEGHYTDQMQLASLHIRIGADAIDNIKLRSLQRQLGDAYRQQLRAIVAANTAVINKDQKAGQRAIAQLQVAADHKLRVIERLAAAFPEVGKVAP